MIILYSFKFVKARLVNEYISYSYFNKSNNVNYFELIIIIFLRFKHLCINIVNYDGKLMILTLRSLKVLYFFIKNDDSNLEYVFL